MKVEGTYKLDGDKLSFKLKFKDMIIEESVTVTKLTNATLEATTKDGKSEGYKKVKPKE